MRLPKLIVTAVTAICVASSAQADAQEPAKEIMLIVPHAAGTGVDAVARSLLAPLQTTLERTVVVDNRVGASGAIGSASVARAKPDGTTIMLNANPPFVTFPLTQDRPLYNPMADFKPLARVGTVPMVLVVSAQSETKTLEQLLAFAKSHPAKANYASPGVGSAGYLAMERLKAKYGLRFEEVLYKSTPQSLIDVTAGHVLAAFSSLPAASSLIEGGKLRALAVGSTARISQLPATPTLAELTGEVDFLANVWYGFLAPAGISDAMAEQLYAGISKAFATEAAQRALRSQGIVPELQSPKEFERSLALDDKAARRVMRGNP
ncbi:tripartite tricarboxylate transporter substrate binding protein [Variovorax sp. J22P271]|uniref:Bug family tripartite tricarboxylate transporter substrate binding protein n=1 Tax=Variovorax davisae TaxID=3053515 RepID=UPI0025780D55|nr:tripartite tricarboxylate transporter substrate binding protein [Variovorax sp. J22P271]MDM0032435.1 tripartite tricarboxylate transporter substrate binding protein [Variovorax sp. J22P271]